MGDAEANMGLVEHELGGLQDVHAMGRSVDHGKAMISKVEMDKETSSKGCAV